MIFGVNSMLLQYRVKNDKSIRNELILDFTAGKGREMSESLIIERNVKILPVIAIYGSNASGKTNIINSICDMFADISKSHTNGDKEFLNVVPFLFDDSAQKEPTERELFFVCDKYEYQYGYIAHAEKIKEEWLYRRLLSPNETEIKTIFERKDNTVTLEKKYSELSYFNGFVGDNNLYLSILGVRNEESLPKIGHIFPKIYSCLKPLSYHHYYNFSNELAHGLYAILDDLKNNFMKFIHEFDSSIEDIYRKGEIGSDGRALYRTFTKHNKKEYPLEIESTGTRKLVSLYAIIFVALYKMRTTIICDELDNNLHPLIMRRIVRMFHSKKENQMNSQLIFSSHNLIVLDNNELRRDEIWFAEKENDGNTVTYSLDSFNTSKSEIRADLDYGKHYLSGRFGAIPYINYEEAD